MPSKTDPFAERKLFGRKIGRRLGVGRQQLFDTLFPSIDIKEYLKGKETPIHPKTLFDKKYKNIHIEIGFGDGDMLRQAHVQNTEIGYIGCEPFMNGVCNLLNAIKDNDLSNTRLWQDDALVLLAQLEENSVDRLYIMNPDPWPKKRHYKRRVVRPETLDLFAKVLKKDALLIMTTDVDDLAEWMVTQASNHPDFDWQANDQTDWQTAPKDWIQTKYEKKGIEAGRVQTYLIFKRQ
jgi:tRNA (guanine-N7-)-methyltransferase